MEDRTYNEAKGEPRVGLDDGPGVVAAVVTPADEAFVAFHLLAERVLAAREDDAHGCGLRWARAVAESVGRVCARAMPSGSTERRKL